MRVLISVPNTGSIHKLVNLTVLRLLQDKRHSTTYIQPTWRPYEHSMNRIALDVIKGGFDYWLNIDSDNPPVNNPLDLIEYDLDIIGLPTPVWNDQGTPPIYFNAMDWHGDGWLPHRDTEGLQEVDAVGTGCILISRKTLLLMSKPFERTTDPAGIVEFGPDFNFCRKARAMNFKVWAHFDYPCQHFNTVDLLAVSQAIGVSAEACHG